MNGVVGAAGFLCGAAGLALLSLAPSAAGNGEGVTGPVIVSHVDGQQVEGLVPVEVRSGAPAVLIAWKNELEVRDDLGPVETSNGAATQRLSTSGYRGPTTVVARECSSTDGDSCTGPETSLDLDVANPPLEWGHWLDEIHRDVYLGQDWDAAWREASSGSEQPAYGFWLDGEPAYLWSEPIFAIDIEALHLVDGTHTLQAARCADLSPYPASPADELVRCDMAGATESRPFVVRTALHPTITEVRARRFSPDGNGVRDQANVTVDLETRQQVTWRILGASGNVLASRDVGILDAGSHSFDVDGRDPEGKALPSGHYELQVRTSSDPNPVPNVDDRVIVGSASTGVDIDLDRPKVTKAMASYPWFHPRVDGFRDRVRVRGVLSETASVFHVEIRRNGNVVRRLALGSNRKAGDFVVAWNGRNRQGNLVRPGRYRYSFVARDRAGNTGSQHAGAVEVRRQR